MRIPLIKPYITDEVKAKVLEVLDSGYLTEGPVTRELEADVRAFTGARHAIAVTSCTTGLEMALRCLGIGAGDEVIVPDYTYPATAAVVAIVGATAVIVDVDPATMLLDYQAAEAAISSRTKAIIPVSLFGNPLDYRCLNDIKRRHDLLLVEDAACAIGAEFDGRKVGTLADVSVFSLHPRKFITTGEGGMVTTADDRWAAWMESYKHFGIAGSAEREGVVFERVGTNYKLSNIQAAVGVVQMRHVRELLTRRIALSERYAELLRDEPRAVVQTTTGGGLHSRQSFCVTVNERDRVMKRMRADGVEAQIGSYALHRQPAFQGAPFRIVGRMKGSAQAFERCLALPLYHDLSADDQDAVVSSLVGAL